MPPSQPVSDNEGEMESPEGVSLSGNEQPEVENPTQSSSHRRRKSKRGLMGIRRSEYFIKGNDPLDYEQKFPEDKQYEELGPAARVWRTYLEVYAAFDMEMVEGWRDGLDVLLVFAGLFSAVVTTFVAQTSQSLQADYSQVTASLLFELIVVQRAAANGSLVNDVPRSALTPFSNFRPTTSDSLVNGLWFTSLSFSLITALFAVLTKQWIHQYMSVPSGTARDRCHVRHFRYMGLQQWGVGVIIGLLPVLMSASLFIFLVGLVVFLVPLQVTIASIVGSITFISFVVYFITNFLPIQYPSCPYKTPLSQYVFPLWAYIAPFFTLISWSSRNRSQPPPISGHSSIRTLREAEHAAVVDSADKIEACALLWLFSTTSNPGVQSIVVEAIGALSLNSVMYLQPHAAGIFNMCETLMYNPLHNNEERKLDRLIRTCLRGTHRGWLAALWVDRERLSPDVKAELLSVSPYVDEEVRSLINAQITNNDLPLQPIVWGTLLRRILPSSAENGLLQWLFHAIPPSYWRIDYPPPTLFLTSDRVQICSIPGRDHCAVSLSTAVNKYLYPYVADVILDSLTPTDSSYHYSPVDKFAEPRDPRLHSLLMIASSHSIQKAYNSIPSINSFFATVILAIGHYVAVDTFLLDDDNNPSSNLDTNRYAALKVLYALVSSNQFGSDSSVRIEDMRITLTIFLRILCSTSPRPCFIPDDWCTPTMAGTFVRIAFQDDARISPNETGHRYFDELPVAAELACYFLQFPPVVNEAFSHFVSRCLLGRISSLRGRHFRWNSAVSSIVDAFINGLDSDVLNSETIERSIDYLFEPDNLFMVCAVLLMRRNHSSLRRLALLRPDDAAWPECLTKLDTFPAHFEVEDELDPDIYHDAIPDFRAFVEGGRVGDYGLDISYPPQQDLHQISHLRYSSSRIKSWLNKRWPRSRANLGDTMRRGDGQV